MSLLQSMITRFNEHVVYLLKQELPLESVVLILLFLHDRHEAAEYIALAH